jgi:hypothetical protein
VFLGPIRIAPPTLCIQAISEVIRVGSWPCHPVRRSWHPYNRRQRLEAVCIGRLLVRHFSEAIMKAILSAALVLGLCGFVAARDDKADPIGTWKCDYDIGGMKRMSTLTIKKDGDKLAGTMSWPDQKEAKLENLKLKDGTLTFTAERQFMDNKITIEYKFTINGDKLKGKGAAEVGGEKRDFDIEAKREKKDK